MDSGVPCEVCGCTEYTLQACFYICNNCDTQSQRIEVQHFEEFDFRRAADDEEREEVISNKSISERKLTSWECYNILLANLVDELVELGASKKIKVLAFQLWAAYLQWAKVAFMSKSEEKLPALPVTFTKNDADILYGMPNLRAKLVQKLSRKRKRKASDVASVSVSIASSKSVGASSKSVAGSSKSVAGSSKSAAGSSKSVVDSTKSVAWNQRNRSLNETMNQSDPKVAVIETLESLEAERASQKAPSRKIVFRSSARAALNKIAPHVPFHSEAPSTSRKRETHRKSQFRKVASKALYKTPTERAPNRSVTSLTLITIVRVALQLVNDEISLADILRWISEGRLSIIQPEKLVPMFYNLTRKKDFAGVQRKGFQQEILNLTCNLKLADLPTPNLFKLAERYCSELCVPDDFLKLVLKLMVDSKVEMNYENYGFRIFPDYECRVMAFVLFVFKLVFSLDDFAEFHQSVFADAVNKLQSESKDGLPRLFSWNSWVKFVECRKSVLSPYNAPISELAGYEKYCEERVFLNHWDKVKPTWDSCDKLVINEALLSSLKREVRLLSSESTRPQDRTEFVDSPASLTPWNTLTKHVLKNCSHSLPPEASEILSENFKTHSIKYAVDAKWCSDIAQSLNVKVERCSLDDLLDLEIFDASNFPYIRERKFCDKSFSTFVPVLVHYTKQPKRREGTDALYRFEGSMLKHDSESTDQRDEYELKLYNAAYWCLHWGSFSSVEAFDDVAKKTFPRSFLWLLCECCNLLRADLKTLCLELYLVEQVLHRLYGKKVTKKKFMNIHTKEW